MHYVFAKSTYLLVGRAAVSQGAAADVGRECARIKGLLHTVVATLLVSSEELEDRRWEIGDRRWEMGDGR